MANPSPAPALFSGPDAPEESELYKCVHCGFCLEACPTYVETGLETESPRGRIALMKAVNESRIQITPNVVRHWDLCIQCRACEPACPSGVPYGRLIEATMAQVKTRRKMGLLARATANLSLKHILPHQNRLAFLVGALRLYQRSGLQRALRKSHLLQLVPGRLAEMETSLPHIPSTSFHPRGQVVPAKRTKKPRGQAAPADGAEKPRDQAAPADGTKTRVALLSGCVMPLVHGPQMDAVVRVLSRNGCEVVVPQDQVCCGALNTHVGDLDTARDLARRNIDAFLASNVDAIVVASAGCGIRMKEYGHLLRHDSQYAERAHRFDQMVKDVHEFLAELPFDPPRAPLSYRVTYQDSCHLSNAQRVTQQPRELLRSIPGIQFVELENAAMCCGGGGSYSITERGFSLKVMESKMKAVKDTGADVIATANPGCVIQLQYGAQRQGLPLQVRYVTDLLDEAYRLE